uniref:Uncharacterized protein n=1 Tax=Panagrolaimus sp. ES5 TaxID=591445 RepID=A0AC34G2V9_9BILA
MEFIYSDITSYVPRQYSKEIIENWSNIEPGLSQLMKKYRPIKISDYQYGLSNSRKQNSRLIVFEFDDKTKVREYRRAGNFWRCCVCSYTRGMRHGKKIKAAKLFIKYGIVFVDKAHNCKSRDISIVNRIQDILESTAIVHTNYNKERAKEWLKLAENNTNDTDVPAASKTNTVLTTTASRNPKYKEEEDDDCIILDVKPKILNG